jgi:hypothetical protein
MGTDDTSKLGLAEKKQKSGKPACGVFALVAPFAPEIWDPSARRPYPSFAGIRPIRGQKIFPLSAF